MSKTIVSIVDDAFYINGVLTYPGRFYQDMRIEGLLLNSRMVQGVFDDANPQTVHIWDYPDGPWDPNRNTREFIQAMPLWRAHGLLSFTLNLQGGSPQGYSATQPWVNSAFEADGRLKTAYMDRLAQILDRADELDMAPILGFFYFGQDERLRDEAAVVQATRNATDWLIQKGYTHVLVEINNECNAHSYEHEILRPARVHELIDSVKDWSRGRLQTPAGRLLVSASMTGGKVPPDNIVESSDFLLVHGNGRNDPDRIRHVVEQCRASRSYHHQPIVFNEDDHFDFDQADNHMLASIGCYASWGFFDYRMKGEGLDEGYQCLPVNWDISSDRKRGFFDLLAKVTGADASA